MEKKYLILVMLILLTVAGIIIYFENKKSVPANLSTSSQSPQLTENEKQVENVLSAPVAEFMQRITKKPFGIYVTPQNSPVMPEKFTGYHTAIDVEYEDTSTDVPVYAVSDGKVVLSRTASGYGGVIAIEININDQNHTIIYGHIRPSTLPKMGSEVKKGEQIGLLGIGYSAETDNERKHLHFGILSDNRIDLRGYVQNEPELSGWIDPITLY